MKKWAVGDDSSFSMYTEDSCQRLCLWTPLNSISRDNRLYLMYRLSEFTSVPAKLPAGAPRREIGSADTAPQKRPLADRELSQGVFFIF